MATQSMVGTFRVKIVFVITLQLIFSVCFGQGEVLENSCDPPDAGVYANLLSNFEQREKFTHGESIEYRCPPGTMFRAFSLKRICENGHWSTALLDCQPVMCPPLYGIRHGKIFQETGDLNKYYGSVVEYTCDTLFVLKGSKYRVCGQDGRWSGDAPECVVEPFCPEYEESLYNGMILYEHDRRLVDTFAFFRCNSDSDLFPSRPTYAECLPSQSWSPAKLPKCLKKAEINFTSNTKYYLMKNGTMIKYIRRKDPPLQHGTQITVSCRNGFELKWRSYLNTPAFVSTNKNGTWDPYIPYCVKARCSIINIVNNVHTMVWYENGTKVEKAFIEHDVKVYENCSELYEMSDGNRRLQTFSDRCFKGRIGLKTCKPKSCSTKSLPQEHTEYRRFSELSNDFYSHSEKVIVSCNPNTEYELVEEETGQYLKDFQISCHFGQWTPVNIPVCIGKPCKLPKISFGKYLNLEGHGEFEKHGSKVDFGCYTGYDMILGETVINSFSSECEFGDWDKNVFPECKPQNSETGKPVIDEEATSSSNIKSTTDGCWTPGDFSISPQLEDGTEVGPNVWVDEGTILHISCLLDYDFLNDTILCRRDGTWNLTDDFCPESDFELSDCPPLSNGEVSKLDNGLNKLQCNAGFSLNWHFCKTTRCSENSFTCGNALCTPDDCEIPGKLDPFISLRSGSLSLSSRSKVKHGDSITLQCTEGYVPTAKQLICSAGKFLPESKNKQFHSCEKAKCDVCTFGTCIDHGQCECNEGYTGERCNEAICQEECKENGGFCSKPFICECPEGREGIDCSKPMCAMPDTNALFNPKQDWYSINSTLIGACDNRHTLIGNPSITCQKSGLWFGSFHCEPLPDPVMYRFDIYTGSSKGAETDANVEISIIGKEGRVTFKLDRDMDYHWPDGKLFENNGRDRFLINNNINTGKVTEIILRHDGAGTFPTWYVTKVTLYVNQTEEFYHFDVYKWISPDQPLSIKSERGCKFDVEDGYPGGHPMKSAVRTWILWECNIVCNADVGCVGTVHRNDGCSLLFYKPRRLIPSSSFRTSLKRCDSNMNT